MIRTYQNATILLGGKPLVTADVTTEDAPRAARPAFDLAKPFSFTATLGPVDVDAMAEVFGVVSLPPTQPAGYVSIPWGILGSLRLNGVVASAGEVSATSARMEFAMPENEVRRAVSVAVQQAIVNAIQRDVLAFEVWSTDEPAVVGMPGYSRVLSPPSVRRMAGKIVGRRYRGERKRRKAMRRLLRAAGILGGDR